MAFPKLEKIAARILADAKSDIAQIAERMPPVLDDKGKPTGKKLKVNKAKIRAAIRDSINTQGGGQLRDALEEDLQVQLDAISGEDEA